MSWPTVLRVAFITPAALAICAAAWAAPQDYVFKPLLPQSVLAPLPDNGVPALAAAGLSTLQAHLVGPAAGVLRVGGGLPRRAIASSQAFNRFGEVTLNARGQVAFEGSPAQALGEGIFRGDGDSRVQIAGTRDLGDFDFVNVGPSINARGQVAFIGERIVDGRYVAGVWAGNGGPVRALVDASGEMAGFSGNPALNDAMDVAFLGERDDGVSGVFLARRGQAPQTVFNSTATGAYVYSDPVINRAGDVAFGTYFNRPQGGVVYGVHVVDGTGLRTVAQASGIFGMRQPSINNLGQVAFIVEPRYPDQVLVTGPDLQADRVIGSGDLLEGRRVSGVLFGRQGLNDDGQLVFTAVFRDGSTRAYLATPVAPR